ncbi:MAG: YeeE/YedE family protein [Nitrospirae bacterium]|nr:YeeE/YedE family protein [Nitrospirota bacterium]
MEKKNDRGWGPYIPGVLTGLVIIASAWSAKQYFGASTCFVRASGYLESIFLPEHVTATEYFNRFVPAVDWQVMMVIGIFIGALISSISDGSFKIKAVPDMWASRFGDSPVKRGIFAFIGGMILMVGARLAGGCPSGYGLGEIVQLALSGLIVVVCFFAGGILFANIIYHGGKRK